MAAATAPESTPRRLLCSRQLAPAEVSRLLADTVRAMPGKPHQCDSSVIRRLSYQSPVLRLQSARHAQRRCSGRNRGWQPSVLAGCSDTLALHTDTGEGRAGAASTLLTHVIHTRPVRTSPLVLLISQLKQRHQHPPAHCRCISRRSSSVADCQ